MTHYTEGSPLNITPATTPAFVRIDETDTEYFDLPVIGYAVVITYSHLDNPEGIYDNGQTDETGISPVVILDGAPHAMSQLRHEFSSWRLVIHPSKETRP